MLSLQKGRYVARLAQTPADISAAQILRALCFRVIPGGHGPAVGGPDACSPATDSPSADRPDVDAFDGFYTHVLIEDVRSGALVCCFRLLDLPSGEDIQRSYSAQYYDLERLSEFEGAMAELGRFCIHPDCHDPDILRVAWGALTRHVDHRGVQMLFGCTSFRGTDPARFAGAFDLLRKRHLAPRRWQPGVKAAEVVCFGADMAGVGVVPPAIATSKSEGRASVLELPPLLRTYLLMGGWVGDHAVIDRDLGTLHVFTGLEIRAIPAGRARLLRAVAG